MKIGIYGHGLVGKATALLTEGITEMTTYCYDIEPERCLPESTTLKEIADSDLVFICLPTPIKFSGACHTEIVEEAVQLLRNEKSDAHIVIRSTVVPGTCHRLGCHHMPNFTTGEGWKTETQQQENWVIGVNQNVKNVEQFKTMIGELLTQSKANENIANDEKEFMSLEEAEIVKYTRNAFLATKISFFNEIKNYCERVGADYQTVSRVVTQDPRIGTSHSQVPGPDGKMGFAGRGLMKDLMALCISMESVGNAPLVLRPVLGRNARKDRPNENWNKPIKTVPITSEALDRLTISQLRNICEQRKIDTGNCVEKIELREKIIDHDAKLRQEQQEMENLEKERQEQQRQMPSQMPQGRQGHMYNQTQPSFQDQLNTIRARQAQMQGGGGGAGAGAGAGVTFPGQGRPAFPIPGQAPGAFPQAPGAFPQAQTQGAFPQAQTQGALPQAPGAFPQAQGQGAFPQGQAQGAFPQAQGAPQAQTQGAFPTQYPHQFGMGQYGTGYPPPAGGGPVQMNIPQPTQTAPPPQRPGPMSVQNGSRSLNPPQSSQNNGTTIGFNGGVQSSF